MFHFDIKKGEMKNEKILTLSLLALNALTLFSGLVEDTIYRTLMPYSTLPYFLLSRNPLPLDFMQVHTTPILLFKLELLTASAVILFSLHAQGAKKIFAKISGRRQKLFAIMILASIIPIWVFNYVPSADGPNRLLEATILREYDNPEYDYPLYFDKNPRNLTNMLFQLFALILKPLDIILVEKIFLSLVFILTPLSVYYFLKAFGDTQGKEFISLLFLYTIPLSMGFYNYLAGMPLIFITLGYYTRNQKKLATKKIINLLALLLLCFITHVFHFLFTATVIILLRFFEGDRKQKIVAVSVLTILAATTLILTFPLYNIQNTLNSREIINQFTKPEFGLKIYKLYRHLIPHSIIGVLTVTALAALLAYSKRVSKTIKKNKKYANIALVFLILYFLTPTDLYKGYVGMRLATPAFLMMLPWIKIRKKDQALLKILVSIILVFVIVNHMIFFERYNDLISEFTSRLELVDANPKIYPMIRFDKRVHGSIGADPLIFAWGYYLIEKGGVTPFVFASPHHVIVYKDWMECREPRCEFIPPGYPVPLKDSCREERFYDYVLTWGVEFPYRVCGNFKLKHWSEGLRIYERT